MGASVVWIACVACRAWPFTVDDAYIVAGYARHLHDTGRYSLDGTRSSDGVTGPLWLVPFVLAHAWGASPLDLAKATGLLSALVSVAAMLRGLRRRQGARWLVPAAALTCASQSDLAIWAVGGMETGVAMLLMVTSAGAVTRQPRGRAQSWVLGVSIGLLAWLRPETAVFGAVLLLGAWSRDRRSGVLSIGVAAIGMLGVATFRWLMFRHVWPLSAAAKPAELGHGVHYVLTALPLLTGVVGVGLFVHGMRVGRVSDRWVGAAVVAHVIAVLLAGGDWMPGFRLLAPIVPLYAWVVAVGAARLRRRGWGVLLIGAACVLPMFSLWVQVPRARASGEDRARGGHELAHWLRTHACRVALVDVGYLVYASGVTAVDLAGVTDASIARLPGGHVDKRIPVQQLLERAPDTLILRGKHVRSIDRGLPQDAQWHSGTERRLARSAAIVARFRPVKVVRYADGYVYYVLQRPDAQRCSSR